MEGPPFSDEEKPMENDRDTYPILLAEDDPISRRLFEKILVKEGDTVRGGQRIAEMGRSGSNRAMLHFEIRRDGKPRNPVRYLPK